MIKFSAVILRYNQNGEKTGWRYITVPAALANQLMPGNRKAFRVKGFIDEYAFEGISLIPIGEGDFIIALNATIRKAIGKGEGAMVQLKLEVDTKQVEVSPQLLECLADEPVALAYFNKLPKSHQNYYSKWIESAKSTETKAKRIAQTVTACSRKQRYNEMIRSIKEDNNKLFI